MVQDMLFSHMVRSYYGERVSLMAIVSIHPEALASPAISKSCEVMLDTRWKVRLVFFEEVSPKIECRLSPFSQLCLTYSLRRAKGFIYIYI